MKVYWDACIFIAWILDEQRPTGQMEGVYYWANEIQKGKVILVTSNITRAEVLDCTLTDEQKKKFEGFLKRPNVSTPAANNKIMGIVHEIRDYYQNLKSSGQTTLPTVTTPDAIHLATGIYYECDEFHTFDEKDKPKRRALIPLSNNVAGKYRLKICIPAAIQQDLFSI